MIEDPLEKVESTRTVRTVEVKLTLTFADPIEDTEEFENKLDSDITRWVADAWRDVDGNVIVEYRSDVEFVPEET